MNLDNLDFIKLQSSHMQNDPTTIALCKALDKQFRKLSLESQKCLIYPMIDYLDEPILDILAYDLHVDFYQSDLDISIKRSLLKEAFINHKIKGTPGIVEKMATTVFGRTKLKEWFEYGGRPYYFKMEVEVTNQGASEHQLNRLDDLINKYKNKRSWLEKIDIFLASVGTFFIGTCCVSGEEITVYPWSPQSIELKAKVNVSTGPISIVETSTVYPERRQ